MYGDKVYTIGNRKVAIIGVGYVGASIAYALSIRNLAKEIVLIDVNHKKAEGEALDIQHGIPYMGISSIYAGDYSDCSDCDLIIITAGRNRKPGETRLNLIHDNSIIMKDVISSMLPYYTRGSIMIVSNPVDILVQLASLWMSIPNGRIFGSGCILDTSRLVRCISDYTGLNADVIKAFVSGEHGDEQFPVWSHASIAGIPISEYCQNVGLPWNDEVRNRISNKVKHMGAEIIGDKGRTHYGIATCVCYLAEAVLNQRLTIASVSSPLEGEFGIKDVALSIPSIIGVNGVEKRLIDSWNKKEIDLFHKSAVKMQLSLNEIKDSINTLI